MKRLLCIYLAVITLLKAVSIGYLSIVGTSDFPTILFLVSAVLVVFGVIVALRNKNGTGIHGELSLYFMIFGIGTLFSLIYVNLEVLSDIGIFEMAMTGNLLDVVVAFVAAVLFLKKAPVHESKAEYISQSDEATVTKVQ